MTVPCEQVHKFSKFIHGTSVLLPDMVQAVPYWIDDESIRKSIIQSSREGYATRAWHLHGLQWLSHAGDCCSAVYSPPCAAPWPALTISALTGASSTQAAWLPGCSIAQQHGCMP